MEKVIRNILSHEFLELIILPTEQCNFRCTYCYEDFSIGKMEKSVVTAIKNYLSKRTPTLKLLKISWFGGEPLVAKDIIFDIAGHILTLQNRYPNLHYESNMTTNGYHLHEALLNSLCVMGVRGYQISLDGPKNMHNITRVRANGSATFDKIWDNLLLAKRSRIDFKITLRVHVTPTNCLYLPMLIDDINANFKYDDRFSIFFKAIENLGGPTANTFRTLHEKDKPIILNDLYKMVHRSIFIEKIEDRKPYICYAAQGNSFVIRANGRIGKCTVALEDERNDIGFLSPDGDLVLDSKKLQPWLRGIPTFNLANLACPLDGLPNVISI